MKNRMHTMIVGLTLALGIGATTAMFSVLYATILHGSGSGDIAWRHHQRDGGAAILRR